MKVKELIEKLELLNSDAEVKLTVFGEEYDNFENERCVESITASKHVHIRTGGNIIEILADNFEES